MRFTYEALFCVDDEGTHHAHLPDIESCWTSGPSFEEALDTLAAILEEYLAATLAVGDEPPPPRYDHRVYDGFFSVLLSVHVDDGAEEQVVTAAEAARMLGVSRPRVSALLQKGILTGYREGRNMLVHVQSIYNRLRYYPRASSTTPAYPDSAIPENEPSCDASDLSYESEEY